MANHIFNAVGISAAVTNATNYTDITVSTAPDRVVRLPIKHRGDFHI